MNYKKMLLLALMLSISALTSVKAELITADTSGGSGTLYYGVPSEGLFEIQELYYSSYAFTAWYDTDTGDGHYIYTCNGGYDSVTIELTASGGTWYQTSYYAEGMFTDFTLPFWLAVSGL